MKTAVVAITKHGIALAAQRAYELNSKAITTSDQMLSRLTQM